MAANGGRVRARRGLAIALALGAVSALGTAVTVEGSLAWPLLMAALISAASALALPFVQLRLYASVPPRLAGAALVGLALGNFAVDSATWALAQATSARILLVSAAAIGALAALLLLRASRSPSAAGGAG